MGRSGAGWAAVAIALWPLAGGCRHTVRYDTDVTHPEEFRPPPHEPRFDNPPEQGYRKPPPKQEFKPGFGGPAGMGGPGGF